MKKFQISDPLHFLLRTSGKYSFLLLLFLLNCAGPSPYCTAFTPYFINFTPQQNSIAFTKQLFEQIKRERTVFWEMRNILYESSDQGLNKFKNMRQSTISASATLYDDLLVRFEKESQFNNRSDSLMTTDSTITNSYYTKHEPDKYFRIEVLMQSHFAQKSLDSDLWTIYLVDENGDMYEPAFIDSGTIMTTKVERWIQNQRYFEKQYSILTSLYFPHVTFYKERIIDAKRKQVKLVYSYKQEVIGEGMWCLN